MSKLLCTKEISDSGLECRNEISMPCLLAYSGDSFLLFLYLLPLSIRFVYPFRLDSGGRSYDEMGHSWTEGRGRGMGGDLS